VWVVTVWVMSIKGPCVMCINIHGLGLQHFRMHMRAWSHMLPSHVSCVRCACAGMLDRQVHWLCCLLRISS
jgi:hypothetical protein